MRKPLDKRRDINHKPLLESIPLFMKHNRHSHEQGRELENGVRLPVVDDPDQTPIDFVPSPDEVARRAYLNYVNQGAQPGHDVQHWLEAEKQLLAARNLTRVHGGHNRT
jgi:hypothetical protein